MKLQLDLFLTNMLPRRRKTTVSPIGEWYTQAVDKARREKRKWKRKWRATGLTIHKEIFSAAKDARTKVIAASKRDFLTKQISISAKSQKALFHCVHCVNQLRHRKRPSQLPDVDNSNELAEMIAEYFEGK